MSSELSANNVLHLCSNTSTESIDQLRDIARRIGIPNHQNGTKKTICRQLAQYFNILSELVVKLITDDQGRINDWEQYMDMISLSHLLIEPVRASSVSNKYINRATYEQLVHLTAVHGATTIPSPFDRSPIPVEIPQIDINKRDEVLKFIQDNGLELIDPPVYNPVTSSSPSPLATSQISSMLNEAFQNYLSRTDGLRVVRREPYNQRQPYAPYTPNNGRRPIVSRVKVPRR